MAIGNKRSFNGLIREYFSDVAGITSGSKSLNDSIRSGLESLGYSGALSSMLRQWANNQAGSGTSLNSAFRMALSDMVGETGTSIGSMMGEYNGINWNLILTKYEVYCYHNKFANNITYVEMDYKFILNVIPEYFVAKKIWFTLSLVYIRQRVETLE